MFQPLYAIHKGELSIYLMHVIRQDVMGKLHTQDAKLLIRSFIGLTINEFEQVPNGRRGGEREEQRAQSQWFVSFALHDIFNMIFKLSQISSLILAYKQFLMSIQRFLTQAVLWFLGKGQIHKLKELHANVQHRCMTIVNFVHLKTRSNR